MVRINSNSSMCAAQRSASICAVGLPFAAARRARLSVCFFSSSKSRKSFCANKLTTHGIIGGKVFISIGVTPNHSN